MASPIDFSQEASFARMLNNLQEETLFTKVTDNSVAASFLKAVAKENAYNYLGFTANIMETSWDNAVNASSLLAKTKLLEYTPHRKVGAIGSIKVSAGPDFLQPNIYPRDIDIPLGSVFSGGGLQFTVVSGSVIPANYEAASDPFTVDVVQGYPEIVNYTVSQTEDYAKISLAGDSIEENNIFVWVNGVSWSRVDSLRSSPLSADTIFSVDTLPDHLGVSLNFGNEVFGKRLDVYDEVRIMYLVTAGSNGNVASSGVVDTVDSVMYDIDNNVVELVCSNQGAIKGGKDYESLSSIRDFAPSNQQVKTSVNSIPEYVSYLNGGDFPFLDKTVVWGASEINEDNNNAPGTYIASEDNKVYIAGISYDGNQATDYEETLRASLDLKKGPTALIQVVDVNLIYVWFHVTAYVRDLTYTLKQVRENVRNVLQTEYTLENRSFKEEVNNSQFVAVISSANGVHHHVSDISFFKQEKLPGLVIPIKFDMEDIVSNNSKLYIKHVDDTDFTLIANAEPDTTYVDSFIGVGAWASNVFGGFDIRNGNGSVTLNSPLLPLGEDNYEYKLTFDTNNTDAILTKRNQLLVYGDVTTEAKYDKVH